MNIEQTIKKIIATHFKKDESDITTDMCVIKDLGADSLDLIEIFVEIEDAFGLDNIDPPENTKVIDVVEWIKFNVQS